MKKSFFYVKPRPNSISRVPDYHITRHIKLCSHNFFAGDLDADITAGRGLDAPTSLREGFGEKKAHHGSGPRFHFFVDNHAYFAEECFFRGDTLLIL